MSQQQQVQVTDLEPIRLFRGLEAKQRRAIAALFEPSSIPESRVLFEPGDPATAVYLLAEGTLTLYRADERPLALRPPVLIGELGALTGERRQTRAEAEAGAQLWQISGEKLKALMREQPSFGVCLQQNLLQLVADRVARDQTRLQDMRRNLIATQKAMKKLRGFLIESQDTVVSQTVHQALDELIAQNRRVNYRVAPPATLPAALRIEGVAYVVTQISRTHVSFTGGATFEADVRFSGVLHLDGPEVLISGRVLRCTGNRVDVELDLLIDEYSKILESYLTQVQMLDLLA